MRQTASMRRSATYISLYSGNWIVTMGVGSSAAVALGPLSRYFMYR